MTAEPPVINPPSESIAATSGQRAPQPRPVTSLADPRAVHIMATEH